MIDGFKNTGVIRKEEVFDGVKTRCRNCRRVIRGGQKSFVVRWDAGFARHCNEECADEFHLKCMIKKSGIYF